MKKIGLIFLFIFTIFALSCSTNTAASSSNSNVLDSKVDKKIVWEMGGHLPAQTGMEQTSVLLGFYMVLWAVNI